MAILVHLGSLLSNRLSVYLTAAAAPTSPFAYIYSSFDRPGSGSITYEGRHTAGFKVCICLVQTQQPAAEQSISQGRAAGAYGGHCPITLMANAERTTAGGRLESMRVREGEVGRGACVSGG